MSAIIPEVVQQINECILKLASSFVNASSNLNSSLTASAYRGSLPGPYDKLNLHVYVECKSYVGQMFPSYFSICIPSSIKYLANTNRAVTVGVKGFPVTDSLFDDV